jgi:hypothetical protein
MSDYDDTLSAVPLKDIQKYIVQHCNCSNCARSGTDLKTCSYWMGFVVVSSLFYCTDWSAKESV